jgi:formylglycine-generating enzyme required for sulfatase activity
MAVHPELEMVLSQLAQGRYALRLAFTRPGSAVESTFNARVAIDFDALAAQLPDPACYGQTLSAALFADSEAVKALTLAQGIAAEHAQPLRIRLNIDSSAPELHRLRWETITTPNPALAGLEKPVHLCADRGFLFSRFISSGNIQPFQPAERAGLRALVVVAAPADSPRFRFAPVDVDLELARAREYLPEIERVELAGPGQATLENIREHLNREGAARFDILYLAAHGGRDIDKRHFLLLESAAGKAQPVYVDDFTAGLANLPLMAMLVSCISAGESQDPDENPTLALGPRLAVRGVPAVIAMQGSLSFETAALLLPVFFRELIASGQIDRALAEARWKTSLTARTGWWMPVLYSRLRDNQLFLPPKVARPLEVQYFEPETVYIPAGKFILGREAGPGVPPVETPRHEVHLPAYRIGKYPVTNRQFAEFIQQTSELISKEAGWPGFKPAPDRLDHPVFGITWEQAMRYCSWLSEKTGRRYTLPTEAQWEKAARGTQGALYPWGDQWEPERCNPDAAQVTPVDHYPPQSPYGCFDMVGNIREWTLTRWGFNAITPDYPYPWREDDRNNPGTGGFVQRVCRGGAASDPARMAVTARRGQDPRQPGLVNRRMGFRVALLEAETI